MTLQAKSLVKFSSSLTTLFYTRFVFKLSQSNMPVTKKSSNRFPVIPVLALVIHPYICVTILKLKEDKSFKNVLKDMKLHF